MASMAEIEKATHEFATARAALVNEAIAFQADLNAVKVNHSAELKAKVAAAKAAHGALGDLVAESRGLFVRPKSAVFHGITVGFKKGTGKIEWEDADQVVKLIKKHLEEKADVLIITTEKPAKEALSQLTAAELKKIGVTVEESGDVPFIKDTASEVDKLVAAFLKDEAKRESSDEEEPQRRAA